MADCLAINFRVDASPTFSENTPAVFSFQASESAFNQTSLMIFFFGIIFHLFPSVKSLFDVFSRFYDCLDFQFENPNNHKTEKKRQKGILPTETDERLFRRRISSKKFG